MRVSRYSFTFIGKCKACQRGQRSIATLDAEQDPRRRADRWTLADGRIGASTMGCVGAIWIDCACGKRVRLVMLSGKMNPQKTCNGRCLAATSGACECSCGGANHGASYA